jgi:APA family basic amino acid/polyamine antiporter
MNLPALLIVLFVISILVKGTEGASKANNFIVMLKVSAVIFVIIAGAFFIYQKTGLLLFLLQKW